MTQNSFHFGNNHFRTQSPSHPYTCGGKYFRNTINKNSVGFHVRSFGYRVIMTGTAIGKGPVHLIEHQVTFFFTLSSKFIFFQYQITDLTQCILGKCGTGRVLWRADTNQGSAFYIGFYICYRWHKIIFWTTLYDTVFTICHMHIMVIVP